MLHPPSQILKQLKQFVTQWPSGLAGRGLMLRHLENILRQLQATDLTGVAHDMALWRWQILPWDQQNIAVVSALSEISAQPSLPNWTKKLQPLKNPYFLDAMEAISGGQTDRVTLLWRSHGTASGDTVWLGETCLFFMQRGEEALARMALNSSKLPVGHPIRTYLGALIAYSFDPPEIALRSIDPLTDDFHWIRTLLKAQCLLRMEDRRGVEALKNLWRAIPWHPNLTLKLHDLMASHIYPIPADTDTAVLLYSWDNAVLLQETLQSLFRSDLGGASVLVLNNGSSDHTSDVLNAASGFFGNCLKHFSLPVNIGAPAARNWLLRHTETRRFGTIVFLDDDVLLPPDWLTGLAAHFRQAGKNAVIGCRVMDQAPRQSVQTADVNLLDIGADGDFLIANAGGGELNLGLHDYTRPCLSVTGCCHMMDRRHAEELGGFDLRFSPSQFDDFDLDLRNALQGGHAVYAGRTAIRHCQRSSLNQADSEAKQGHIQGNMLKLRTKYTRSQKVDLLHRNRDILWNDLISKTRDLEQA